MRNEKETMKELKNFNPMALREKYSVRNLNKKNNYSSFWLDNGWDNNTSIFDEDLPVKKGVDLVALASYRRAISNFVSIVTGKTDIKVTFETSGGSYTDGKNVTISSKLDDKLFDSTVGLALHEGSHILLSDFDFLKNLMNNIPKEYFHRATEKGFNDYEICDHIKSLLNYVEDKRIDYFVFSNSPGYKGYYHSMYDKYFHANVVDKALKTDEYTSKNWDSYIFRIINLTNKNTNLNALSGLREIHSLVFRNNGGVKNIKSTENAFEVALNIYDVVLNNIPDGIEKTDSETGEVTYEKADGDSSESVDGIESSNKISNEELEATIEDGITEGNAGGGKKIELTENQKKTLENAIKKQKKFMDEDITKKKLSKKDKSAIDAIDESGMSYKEVGKDLKDRYDGKSKKTKCILVKNLTQSLIDSNTIGMLSSHSYYSDDSEEAINEGLRLGTILGRKLSVRTESRDTKYTRKDTGRIDKRLIAELGFGNNNVFSQTFVDSYPDAFLHISVDASGSMSGSKWTRTMKSVTAMVKAIDMIEGVDVVVSFRSTQDNNSGRRGNSGNYPIMLIAYDSRKDSLVKVKTLWKTIRANGTTPEGLCYEAVMDEMVEGMKDRESYFLNFSDGMPMFSNDEVDYHHNTALNHTEKMVKEIRNRGIKVLSYYIGDSYDSDRYMGDFKRMYGKDSQFVDVTSVTAVSRTMNKKFLEKN